MTTLADDLPKEQERCRELLVFYESIGRGGLFGAMLIKQSLAAAERAAASGDVVAMIHAYKRLKDHE